MAIRSTIFTCIVYPESAPPDWGARLKDLHIQGAVSPLHDLDVNDKGEYKKEHYHIVLKYSSLKSFAQVKSDFDTFGGVYPDDEKLFNNTCVVRSLPTTLRYLCHLDNPEKHQYDVNDIVELGGLSYNDEINQDISFSKVCSDIMEFIGRQHVTNFYDLCTYANHSKREWLPFLIRYSFFFKTYVNSNGMSGIYSGYKPVEELSDI